MNIPEEYINQIEMKLGHPVIDLKLDRHNITNVIKEEFDYIANSYRGELNSEQIQSVLNRKQFKKIVVGVLMQQNALNIIYSSIYDSDVTSAQVAIMAATQLIEYGKYLESKGRE